MLERTIVIGGRRYKFGARPAEHDGGHDECCKHAGCGHRRGGMGGCRQYGDGQQGIKQKETVFKRQQRRGEDDDASQGRKDGDRDTVRVGLMKPALDVRFDGDNQCGNRGLRQNVGHGRQMPHVLVVALAETCKHHEHGP